MGATAVLSQFASKTRIADISAEAIAATKRHILDCAGVGLAAAVEPAGRIVLDHGVFPQAHAGLPGQVLDRLRAGGNAARRRVDLDSFSDEYCKSPRMRAALDKVRVNAHPEWPDDAASRRRRIWKSLPRQGN